MTVEVTRTVIVDIPASEVWDLLADPHTRAMAITLVDDYDVEVAEDIDGDEIVWHVALPVPMIDETLAVRTREVERREDEYIRYTGESSVFDMVGEHELEARDAGCLVRNRFTIDGSLPGVETYLEREMDAELDALVDYVVEETGATVEEA